jgi:predicted transcriptional regulator
MDDARRPQLTRREEQIMEVLFRRAEASVAEIMEELPSSPTSGAVRRMLNLLHAKGAVEYRQDGARKIYRPTVEKSVAGERALSRVVETFFGGSAERTIASLFSNSDMQLSTEEKRTLRDLVERARKRRG